MLFFTAGSARKGFIKALCKPGEEGAPIFDDFVKNPFTALRCILRHCDVAISTPHSSGFARLVYGAFYEIVGKLTFYDFIRIGIRILIHSKNDPVCKTVNGLSNNSGFGHLYKYLF